MNWNLSIKNPKSFRLVNKIVRNFQANQQGKLMMRLKNLARKLNSSKRTQLERKMHGKDPI